jgi:hypothetical protein
MHNRLCDANSNANKDLPTKVSPLCFAAWPCVEIWDVVRVDCDVRIVHFDI